MIIYKHTCKETGESYIGKTIKEIDVRFLEHYKRAQAGKIISHFGNALLKYGFNGFDSTILEDNVDEEFSSEREIYWIEYYNTFLGEGYNMTIGGEGTSFGKNHPMYGRSRKGEENPFFGKSHSEETKLSLSKAKKNKVTCKSIITGESFIVSKKEFDNREDLVGITYGNVGVDSAETRKAKGAKKRGEIQPKFPCIHCGKEMDKSSLTRYHNDNCKTIK